MGSIVLTSGKSAPRTMENLRSGKNCDVKLENLRSGKNCDVKLENLRSGKNCEMKPILVPQAQRGKKRKNPKQCFESDSEDEFLNVLEKKPKIFMKKCDMCGSSFRSQVH